MCIKIKAPRLYCSWDLYWCPWHVLSLKGMLRSVLQPESTSMSVSHAATRDLNDMGSQCCCLRPCWDWECQQWPWTWEIWPWGYWTWCCMCRRAGPDGMSMGELPGWLTQLLPRPRNRALSCLTLTSTACVICWSVWKGWYSISKVTVSPWHRVTTGHPRGILVSIQYW